MPATRAAVRRRGYDPVRLLLARSGVRESRVFGPARPHRSQKTLSVLERAANLEGAFRVRGVVRDRRFLLVDDVVTTGSTLLEAARELRAEGAVVVAAATVAATPKRFGAVRPERSHRKM